MKCKNWASETFPRTSERLSTNEREPLQMKDQMQVKAVTYSNSTFPLHVPKESCGLQKDGTQLIGKWILPPLLFRLQKYPPTKAVLVAAKPAAIALDSLHIAQTTKLVCSLQRNHNFQCTCSTSKLIFVLSPSNKELRITGIQHFLQDCI